MAFELGPQLLLIVVRGDLAMLNTHICSHMFSIEFGSSVFDFMYGCLCKEFVERIFLTINKMHRTK